MAVIFNLCVKSMSCSGLTRRFLTCLSIKPNGKELRDLITNRIN